MRGMTKEPAGEPTGAVRARELFTSGESRMRAALHKAADESDYCFVCDRHPAHPGHAADCPVRWP